jgi:adenine-specific DNA-methyltransferase
MKLLPATTPTAPPMVGAWPLDAVQCCDALDLLRGLPAGSVDAIITDPPYFGVKDEAWDNQWDTADEFIAWMGNLCQQWKRVLKPNGSLYVFASPRMAARVEVEVGKWFNVLNNITWKKDATPYAAKYGVDNFRTYVDMSERIIFAEQFASDGRYASLEYELNGHVFKPLKDWFRERVRLHNIGLSQLNAALGAATNGGGLASGYFGDKVEFQLPTAERYQQMQSAFPLAFDRDYTDLRREYEDLRREYEDLRRPFNATPDAPYTDVWDFKTVNAYNGKHVCEKPLALMSHIIQISTRPGAVVLDCFAGSGATLDAARRLGRRFIGCDFDPHWAARAGQRVTLPYTVDLFSWLALQEVG